MSSDIDTHMGKSRNGYVSVRPRWWLIRRPWRSNRLYQNMAAYGALQLSPHPIPFLQKRSQRLSETSYFWGWPGERPVPHEEA